MRNAKGFTLIELLIVIAIIAILAAVLIPNLIGARKRAFDAAALQCARAVALAAESSRTNALNNNYDFDAASVIATDPKSCTGIYYTGTFPSGNAASVAFSITVFNQNGSRGYLIEGQENGVQVKEVAKPDQGSASSFTTPQQSQ